MARASRCGFTMPKAFGLTAASIEAIIAVVEAVDLSWVESATGARGAPCLWRDSSIPFGLLHMMGQ